MDRVYAILQRRVSKKQLKSVFNNGLLLRLGLRQTYYTLSHHGSTTQSKINHEGTTQVRSITAVQLK